jgi:putative N6-adenine-specific DNA methylase
MEKITYIAKTFAGLEDVLSEELKALGAENIQKLNRAVMFDADMALLYRANLALRTCLRIIQPLLVHEYIRSAQDLYDFARSVNWLRWFNESQTFAVHSVVDKAEQFNNSMLVSLKVKDAIADQFRQYKGERPSVDKEKPAIRIEVHLHRERCTLSIDSSGEALHKRGYREGGHVAPLNEILAAALVLKSGWDGTTTLLDPMCGSGTILTEAAMIAHHIAPNLKRDDFGFQNWKNYDAELYDKVWLEEKAKILPDIEAKIIGFDINKGAIIEARANVTNAGVDESVRLSVGDFFEKIPPKETGMMISNVPYGERVTVDDAILDFYKRMGDQFKQQYQGWTAWILSGNVEAIKNIGLKPTRKEQLFNGAIACSFAKYELYAGRKA